DQIFVLAFQLLPWFFAAMMLIPLLIHARILLANSHLPARPVLNEP
ncbi:MAG: hypothetical protein JWL90_1557, partial [Chthoniobacteraceae bacterium]|nr:hypothetical protein [Chthoniobacteraceae bacterium]